MSKQAALAVERMRAAITEAEVQSERMRYVTAEGNYDPSIRHDAAREARGCIELAAQWAQVVLAEHAAYKMFADDVPAVPIESDPAWMDKAP